VTSRCSPGTGRPPTGVAFPTWSSSCAASAARRWPLSISDGRPFDLDYGQQYGDDAVVAYALADTGRALEEARARGVWPYLITIDPEGTNYLADICEPVEYHVIADPRDLPSAIGELYRVARHRADQARSPRER
jgi:nitric oxide reductase activation protein